MYYEDLAMTNDSLPNIGYPSKSLQCYVNERSLTGCPDTYNGKWLEMHTENTDRRHYYIHMSHRLKV